MKVSIHEALLLVVTIIALFLYWNKPTTVVGEKIIEVHACDKLKEKADISLCVATESCGKEGRKLAWFEMRYDKDDRNMYPVVKCEDSKTEEKK